MFGKNFLIFTNSLCLDIGYAGIFWFEVIARLGIETR